MNTWDMVAKAIKLELDYAREQTFECHNSGSSLLMWEQILQTRKGFVHDLIENLSGLNPRFDSEKFGRACGLEEDEIFFGDRNYYARNLAALKDLQQRRKNSEA